MSAIERILLASCEKGCIECDKNEDKFVLDTMKSACALPRL